MASTARPASTLLPPDLLGKLERMELVSRKIFRGRMKGERRSKRKGQSVEFADFRSYVPGDDLRFIDWNLYARLDRLFLKLFLEEEDLHVFLLIDDSGSMGFGQPTKFEVAQQLAAALGYVGLCRGDRVQVSGLSQTSRPGIGLRGKSSTPRLICQIEATAIQEGPGLEESIKRFCLRNPGKGILVLITDLMDKHGYESALRLLVAKEMDVYLVHLLSPEEIEPQVTGDLKLVDCEDGDTREISVSPMLLKRYQASLASFLEQARSFCNKRSIAYVPARSDQAVEILINQYLRQRGLVR